MPPRLSGIFLFLAVSAIGAKSAHAQSLYPDVDGDPDAVASSQDGDRSDDGETVSDAILAALSHDPQLDVARSQHKAAGAEKFRALGGFLPNIEASVSYTDEDWRSSTLATLEDRDGTTVGVTASQPLFQGFSTLNRFREARARFSQADYALMEARQQIALEAAQAHAGVVLARQIVRHRQENLNLVNKQFEVAQRRMQAGAQSRTGVEQARMRRAQAQVDIGEARAFLAERETAYARVVGRPPPPMLRPDPATDDFGLATLEIALADAIAGNPALNASRAAVKAADHANNAAKGSFAPKFSIEGSYFRRYGETAAGVDDEEYQVIARMRLPIFAQGQNVADLKSSAAAAAGEKAQLLGTRLFVEETISRSWRQLADAKARRMAAANAIEAAALAVKGLQIEYEAGQRTVIDVLDGQRDLVIARISLSQAEHDYRATQYALAAAVGRLAAADR